MLVIAWVRPFKIVTWSVPNVEQFFSPAINFSARNTKDSAMEKQAVLPNVL
jgi:hypothetical protein